MPLLAAGAVEGALLGAAQAHVLRHALPGLSAWQWVAATSCESTAKQISVATSE
jgi:hypothetical protein